MDELFPYPFLALVGQAEMKTALVLALVNPRIRFTEYLAGNYAEMSCHLDPRTANQNAANPLTL